MTHRPLPTTLAAMTATAPADSAEMERFMQRLWQEHGGLLVYPHAMPSGVVRAYLENEGNRQFGKRKR